MSRNGFDNIIGESAAMRGVLALTDSVAASDLSVVITGESGTGKELIARRIHARSSRHNQPFVPVNCSAFPESLFEAELFGYEKGAFTGATQRKPGLLEFAHSGTFFLDEVCEMPARLQSKLLRVLQDQQLRHLGGNGLIQVDVRLISASNRDMLAARTNGELRDDFFFRLNVVSIHVPPLRERVADVPRLAEHFLHQAMAASPKRLDGFDDAVLRVFERYAWPGNVRELENVVGRAVALAMGRKITVADIPHHLLLPETDNEPALEELSLVEAKQRAIDKIERKYLLTLLEKHHGNVTRVAADAGMTRRNLHRLLNRHGLHASHWRNGKKDTERILTS